MKCEMSVCGVLPFVCFTNHVLLALYLENSRLKLLASLVLYKN